MNLEGKFDTAKYSIKDGILYYDCTLLHPYGRWYIQCEKHPEFTTEINFSKTVFKESIVQQMAEHALENCPYCQEERKPYKLAFPEGAEL